MMPLEAQRVMRRIVIATALAIAFTTGLVLGRMAPAGGVSVESIRVRVEQRQAAIDEKVSAKVSDRKEAHEAVVDRAPPRAPAPVRPPAGAGDLGGEAGQIRAAILRHFGTEVMVCVAWRESVAGTKPNWPPPVLTFNPGARGALGELGLTQLHPVHKERAARLGFPWHRMLEVEPNLTVAADLYDEQGLGPWKATAPRCGSA